MKSIRGIHPQQLHLSDRDNWTGLEERADWNHVLATLSVHTRPFIHTRPPTRSLDILTQAEA